MHRFESMSRRTFLHTIVTAAAAVALSESLWSLGFSATKQGYKLAPESLLPFDIRQAPAEVREAYRFAITNRDTLRYVPCYCGCGHEGHTSNASCYIKDNSTPGNLIFDRMSLN